MNASRNVLYCWCDQDYYPYVLEYVYNLLTRFRIHRWNVQLGLYPSDGLCVPDKWPSIPQNVVWHLFIGLCPQWLWSVQPRVSQVIILNTEQLYVKHLPELRKYKNLGWRIWDYDQYQTQHFLPDIAQYVPYLFDSLEHHQLTQMVQTFPKTYDVAFCGHTSFPGQISDRRLGVLNHLRQMGLKVQHIFGFGCERDVQIAHSKVLVNIHFQTHYQIFEHLRCDRWVGAGQVVVSESSASDLDYDLGSVLITCSYEHLVQCIQEILLHYDDTRKRIQQELSVRWDQVSQNREHVTDMLIRHMGHMGHM